MKIEIFQEDCLFKDYRCDDDVFHLCMEFMTEHNLAMSDDVFEITDLYLRFREWLLMGWGNREKASAK